MRFLPIITLAAGDMSLSSVASNGVDLNQLAVYSVTAVFTGAPVGTLILQIANDDVPAPPGGAANMAVNVVDWCDYTGTSVAVTAAGKFTWNVWPAGYRWVRVSYTKTSGTGSLKTTFNAKG